jgi:hypothetical protein
MAKKAQPNIIQNGPAKKRAEAIDQARSSDYGAVSTTKTDAETGYGREGAVGSAESITGGVGLMGAVVVPRANKQGGIPGKGSPYGVIEDGEIVVQNKTLDQASVLPSYVGAPKKVESLKSPLLTEELQTEDILSELESQHENSPSIEDQIIAAFSTKDPGEGSHTAAYVSNNKKRTRVRIRGGFGSYKGNYPEVLVAAETICLLSYEDDDAFCPPAGEDPILMEIGNEIYTVTFPGLEIDLPFCELVMQVYLRELEN